MQKIQKEPGELIFLLYIDHMGGIRDDLQF
jgi:hypothetical protein